MPFFKVYNCFPSFTNTFEYEGVTRTNPLPNYGGVGDHLQDYFVNHMAETPSGGGEALAAFLASQKTLTGIVAADLTGMANNLSVNYGISGSSEGYALLDFRGDSWKHLIGDGIIAASDIGNNPAYNTTKTAAISILNHFKNHFPNIKWAYAGLPHLPKFTTFAPTAGSSFSWAPSLTNNAGATNNNWDSSHPTGAAYGTQIFDWAHTPSELKDFYNSNCISRVEDILDAAGWACPDITPTIPQRSAFGTFTNSVVSDNQYTRALVSLTKSYADAQVRQFVVQPLVCSTLRSRTPHPFDDLGGIFTEGQYAQGVSGTIIEANVGFSGSSAFASDDDLLISTLRAGLLEPAAQEGVHGFVYRDSIPMMIELACTGATPSGLQAQEAVSRARNYIARRAYGIDDTSLFPWSSLKTELKVYFSQEVVSEQLKAISESIPVGDITWRSAYAGGKYAQDNGASTTLDVYDSVAWASGSNQNLNKTMPICPCPPLGLGACCKNNTCADGVSEADCLAGGGSWQGADTLCSNFPNPPCAEAVVNCCISGVSCTPNVPESVCAAQGGVAIDSCANCCTPDISCVCLKICTVQDICPPNTFSCTRTCKFYDLLPNPCCDCANTTPIECDGIGTELRCGSTDCPPCCGTIVSVSTALQLCCAFGCNSNYGGTLCTFWDCSCLANTACVPVGQALTDPNIPAEIKSEIINDLTGFFGEEIVKATFPEFFTNTAFRQTKTIANTVSYYKGIGIDQSIAYVNLKLNYAPTVATVERIQSEFAFDRLLLPISYT